MSKQSLSATSLTMSKSKAIIIRRISAAPNIAGLIDSLVIAGAAGRVRLSLLFSPAVAVVLFALVCSIPLKLANDQTFSATVGYAAVSMVFVGLTSEPAWALVYKGDNE